MKLLNWLQTLLVSDLPRLLQRHEKRRRQHGARPETLEPRVVMSVTNVVAAADAHVRGGATYATTNFGNAATLNVRNHSTASNDYEGFIRFDLSSIAGTIQNATLKLTPQSFGADIKTYGFRIRLLEDTRDNWVEGNGGTDNNPTNEITWANKPTGTGSSPNVVPSTLTLNQAYSVDVTSLIAQNFNTNKLASFQLDVTGASTSRYVFFHSRTATNTTYRPVLVITTQDAANSPPDAINDSATTNEDTPVTVSVRSNDTDPNSDPLTITAVTQGTKGAVTINGGTTVTYSPNANVSGSDSFTYTISDGKGGTDSATVSLTINAVNDAPIANDDSATVALNTATVLSVLTNDTDPEGSALSIIAVSTPAHGSVVINGNGTLTYTPATGYSGSDSLTYTASDGSLTDTAVVSISITTPPPLPTLSIADSAVVEGNPSTSGATFLHTSGSQIVDANGNNVKIAGVNWFGFESSNFAPHGLWTRGYRAMMDQMVTLGFNTIRLPYSNQLFDVGSTPNGIDASKNPDLVGLSGLQIMDKIVEYAGQIGLRIMLDHHRSDAGAGASGNGLWYIDANGNGNINDDTFGEQRWISDWVMLATRYANNPTIVGADLHNEPHASATWGSGSATTDWRLAAQRAGNAVVAANPNWLIVVEGIEAYAGQNYWWGGNLAGARNFPVTLNVPNRVVYSPHDYPASIYPQSWFSAANYPNNLPSVWNNTWGYLFQENLAPVLLGEFGSKLETSSDQIWYDSITKYLGGDLDVNGSNDLAVGQQGMSWTYWSWNPNSGDTGGILQDDWLTVHTNKVAKLTPIQFAFPSGSGSSVTPLSFTVSLSAASTSSVTVNYATSGDTATSDTDFTAASGTLTFAAGETTKTITVNVTRDTTVESDETLSVTLSSPGNAVLGDGSATGTITNDDSAPPPPATPSLSINDLSVTEGHSGTTSATFTVSLSAAATGTVTVSYATAASGSNPATSGTDFTAASGSLSFAAGETSKTITVHVTGDTTFEPSETFVLNLSSASGATIADSQGLGTISNDDTAPVGGATASFVVINDWGAGFQGAITITNNNASPVVNWRLEFDWDRNLTQIWDAVIVSHVGSHYVIEGAAYNRNIGATSALTFGFLADPGNVLQGPLNLVLNGQPL